MKGEHSQLAAAGLDSGGSPYEMQGRQVARSASPLSTPCMIVRVKVILPAAIVS